LWGIVRGFCLTLLAAVPAAGQQPFYTDDAEVTSRKQLHLEFSNQFEALKASAYPNLRQNTAELEIDYGLLAGVELGVSTPFLLIFNAVGTKPRTAAGIGDTNVSLKYRFGGHPPGTPRTFAVSVSLEIPTGKREQQLGSGVFDYGFNSVWQQRLTPALVVRANGGLLASGNTLTGAVGIPGRGVVVTGGTSIVRQASAELQLGVEVTGAFTPRETGQTQAQLQLQVGGNYLLPNGMSVDFGVMTGRFDASPRVAAQLGFSVDF
jgi:hypothetical protein